MVFSMWYFIKNTGNSCALSEAEDCSAGRQAFYPHYVQNLLLGQCYVPTLGIARFLVLQASSPSNLHKHLSCIYAQAETARMRVPFLWFCLSFCEQVFTFTEKKGTYLIVVLFEFCANEITKKRSLSSAVTTHVFPTSHAELLEETMQS